ncbi:unnamed protein product [Strongylus vulgaris]|uniref:Peptidase C1A papain C-terminal domain-containing protein n=1 Tax=Strongylus vulgaris TaxID=40348 RepID=A0A3P7KF21_STRVU|nr:unnamed protein product [Strongylus vulgaris]
MPLTNIIPQIERRKRQVENDIVDFRPYMQPVANQMHCGGCWAFAMTAVLEGFFTINNHDIPALSVQQLLDCDRTMSSEFGLSNLGCGGGYFQVAIEYLKKKGLTSNEAYPFNGESSSSCQLLTPPEIPRMKSYDAGYVFANNETFDALDAAMEERVRRGPVAVGIAVNSNIYSYSEGVFDGTCGATINHAVVIVGFTSQYWIVRNSWGPSWGENGHIRILRHSGDPCKLTQYWAQPTEIGTYPQASSGTGNAIVVPNGTAGTTETTSHECCDGECCEWCDCGDEDDEEYFTSEEQKFLETSATMMEVTTTSALDSTTLEPTTSKTTGKPIKTTRSERKWVFQEVWFNQG